MTCSLGRARSHACVLILFLLAASSQAQDVTTLAACDAATRPLAMTAADVNGDGLADLVVGCSPTGGPASSGPGRLEVHLGAGEGRFEAPHVLRDTEYGVTVLAAADLTDSGAPDLVVGLSGPHERTVLVLAGDGAGRFKETSRTPSDFTITRAALTDVDGDGLRDVAMPGEAVYYRNGGSEAEPGEWSRIPLVGMDERFDVHLADVDADGRADVAHVLPSAGKVRLFATDPATPEEIVLGKAVRELRGVLAGGDLNGDGTLDLAVSTPVDPYTSEVRLALSDGEAWRLSDALASLEEPQALFVRDVNEDGAPDLIATPHAGPDRDSETLKVALGHGDGTFAAAHGVPLGGYAYRPLMHDLTGDGRADLAFLAAAPEPGIGLLPASHLE